MNAEKSFKAMVKDVRAKGFKVSFFRIDDCLLDGDVWDTRIRINSSRDYETRLKTLILLLSKYEFMGQKNNYACVMSDAEAGGLTAHIASFAMTVANAMQAV